jgi:hypothetical protein
MIKSWITYDKEKVLMNEMIPTWYMLDHECYK